jgi:hypothetical protein
MSDRPRAGTRPAGLIASSSPLTIASRDGGRSSRPGPETDDGPGLLDRQARHVGSCPRGPVQWSSRARTGPYGPSCVAPIGSSPHFPARRKPAGPIRRAILRAFPSRRPGRSDRGGHAIARSGRVVRPVRRPTDRQATRRSVSGDPREICNLDHDPGAGAGVSQFPGAPAISNHAGVAGLRTSLTQLRVPSLACSAGAFAWLVWRARRHSGAA